MVLYPSRFEFFQYLPDNIQVNGDLHGSHCSAVTSARLVDAMPAQGVQLRQVHMERVPLADILYISAAVTGSSCTPYCRSLRCAAA